MPNPFVFLCSAKVIFSLFFVVVIGSTSLSVWGINYYNAVSSITSVSNILQNQIIIHHYNYIQYTTRTTEYIVSSIPIEFMHNKTRIKQYIISTIDTYPWINSMQFQSGEGWVVSHGPPIHILSLHKWSFASSIQYHKSFNGIGNLHIQLNNISLCHPNDELIGALVIKNASGTDLLNTQPNQQTSSLTLSKELSLNNTHLTLWSIIPENMFFYSVQKGNDFTFSVGLCIIVVGIVCTWVLTHLITKPLGRVKCIMDDVSNLNFKHYSHSFSIFSEIRGIQTSMNRMYKGLISFQRFIPIRIVKKLMEQNQEARIGVRQRNLTIMFTDIQGFARITEQNSDNPHLIAQLLSRYLQVVSDVVIYHGGTVDKYIGDSVMAFWNAPDTVNDHELQACKAAMEIQRRCEELRIKWSPKNYPLFYTRIGIHTGAALIGNIGSQDRMNYTCIGDNVNLASRIECINKEYGTYTMISEDVYNRVKDIMHCRIIDHVAVKGREPTMYIYELCGFTRDMTQLNQDIVDLFRSGIIDLVNMNVKRAHAHYKSILEKTDHAPAACVLAHRCTMIDQSQIDWIGYKQY
jgi:class 3 adenylate cyclase